ncbi:hypothetical protein BH10PSE17_BH10PSE17_38110 [soil metagenome]
MVRFQGVLSASDASHALRYEAAVQGSGDLRIFDARVYDNGRFKRRVEGRLNNVGNLCGTALELQVQRCIAGSLARPDADR